MFVAIKALFTICEHQTPTNRKGNIASQFNQGHILEIIEHRVKLKTRSDVVKIYPIGDLHIGKINCYEVGIRKIVREIKKDPNALWVGGGDYIEAIKPKDPRFSMGELPDWMLNGDANSVRDRLDGIVDCQVHRFAKLFEPIKDKCVGLIEGNHEATIRRISNEKVLNKLCNSIDVKPLTESAFIRFNFSAHKHTRNAIMYIEHGCGGGRSAGAEPNHLARLIADKDADMICRGHSHTYTPCAPVPRMYIPTSGKLPQSACRQKIIRAFNWGCYLLSYMKGPSVYERRAAYPARPLTTACFELKPCSHTTIKGIDTSTMKIKITEIELL